MKKKKAEILVFVRLQGTSSKEQSLAEKWTKQIAIAKLIRFERLL